jgi:plastocyanin
MSLLQDGLRAFAAGAVCSIAYAAAAVPAEPQVSIDNFAFSPATITVSVGAAVVWENKDDIPHTVVSPAGAFRSPALDTNDKFSFTFEKAGTFAYFCSLHPQMTGKIVVNGG